MKLIFFITMTFIMASISHATENIYTLGAGDKIRLNVFGEDDLSGEYEVDGTGVVSIPLINDVKIGGLSIRESEALIIEKFSDGYLKKPKISIDILNFRPFFILGEVNKPGSYPYVDNLTILNAVATAGGYTYRAKTNMVMLKRPTVNSGEEFKVKDDYKVLPGDIIRVMERFF